ncbi:hypothetical protein [Brevundimonas sp.]|uniref:hypothetical protein n=1 Tax=Brevundimonas sp. TaxID=1871086 RepID=UPI0025D8758F|nr:hypothetical protein [Brevundimonas sp.]
MRGRWMTGAAAAVVTLALAGGAMAQQQIAPYSTVSGRLETRDPVSSTGGRFDRYRLTARPGERVVLTMRSTDGAIDPYLQIGRSLPGGQFHELSYDDDGTGSLDSMLDFIAQEGGDYEVRATSFSSDDYGPYTIERADYAPSGGGGGYDPTINSLPIRVSGMIDSRDPVDGEGRYYEGYRFTLPQQRVVRIRLESDDMDPYVILGFVDAYGQYQNLFYDDDSGGSLNSEFYYQSVADDVFEVRATTYGIGGTGSYRLYVEDVSTTADGGLPSGVAVGGWITETDNPGYGPNFEYRAFYAQAGQRVRVLQRSSEVDSYLYVGRWIDGAFHEIARDDDSGGGETGLDSEINFIAPVTGLYYAKVSTLSAGETGLFSLQVDIY